MNGNSRYVWTTTVMLVAMFVVLTAADLVTTLVALAGGQAVELNPTAANDTGSIRIGFLIVANILLVMPLTVAFALGINRACQVPQPVLAHWWRHIVDIFFISPLNEAARQRRPLRLVTAAMTLLVLKVVIVASNTLVIFGLQNPTSLFAMMWTWVGLTGAARYWAAYAMLIVPCYIAGVGLAALLLRSAQQRVAGVPPITNAIAA